jgi:antitoxin VapB
VRTDRDRLPARRRSLDGVKQEQAMTETTKLLRNGRGQAVRLPAAYRFDGDEVFIRRDPVSGDVLLSSKPRSLDRFFSALAEGPAPDDFLSRAERDQDAEDRDPRAG